VKLRVGQVATRLDSLLSRAATVSTSYIDFLDTLLAEEIDAKQLKRTAMGMQIGYFPSVKTVEDFDYGFHPSVDKKLVDELTTGSFVPHGYNVLLCIAMWAPGIGTGGMPYAHLTDDERYQIYEHHVFALTLGVSPIIIIIGD
jgi:hypothetical protein